MILKVVYHNPNPNGSNVWFCDDVQRYITKNRELHIWRDGANLEDEADVIFAVNQWICNERQLEDEQKLQPVSDRRSPSSIEEQPTRSRRDNASSGRRNTATGRQSTLNDLTYATPESHDKRQMESDRFAADNNVLPGSDAYLQKVKEYEQAVEKEYGPDAVRALPWNQVPRGPQPENGNRRR